MSRKWGKPCIQINSDNNNGTNYSQKGTYNIFEIPAYRGGIRIYVFIDNTGLVG